MHAPTEPHPETDPAPTYTPTGYQPARYGPGPFPAPGTRHEILLAQRLRDNTGRITQRIHVYDVRSAPAGHGIRSEDQRWYGRIRRRGSAFTLAVTGRHERLGGIHAGRLTALVWTQRRPADLTGETVTIRHASGTIERPRIRTNRRDEPIACTLCDEPIGPGRRYAGAPYLTLCAYCVEEHRHDDPSQPQEGPRRGDS